MSFLYRLKISHRIVLLFAALLLGLLYRNVAGLATMARVRGQAVQVATTWLPATRSLGEVRYQTAMLRRYEINIATDPAANLKKREEQFDATLIKLSKALDDYSKTVNTSEEQSLSAAIGDGLNVYYASAARTRRVAELHPASPQARAALQAGVADFENLSSAIERDIQFQDEGAKHDIALADQLYAKAVRDLWMIFAIVTAVCWLLCLWIVRSIAVPMARMRETAAAVARGDFSQDFDFDSRDELGEFAASLRGVVAFCRSFTDELRGTVRKLNHSSQDLISTGSELSRNAESTSVEIGNVSGAATEIAERVSSVLAGTKEMSTSVREISKNTHEASGLATDGVRLATDADGKIQKLSYSSDEIGKVIKVINSIAEQTHLLALNATIEAARAGEAGKGFAVVANEVKELAKQTAQSSDEIGQKVLAIQADSKDVVSAIEAISAKVQQISDTQVIVANAIEEQTAVTQQIAADIESVAHENDGLSERFELLRERSVSVAAAATEGTQCAHELTQLSDHLRDMVGRFKMPDDKDETTTMHAPLRDAQPVASRVM